jgi:hypothetical protein
MSTILSSLGWVLLIVLTTILFRWAQRKGVSIFGPRERDVVVLGTPEEWLQKSYEAFDSTRRFSIVDVSEDKCEVRAKYRRLLVWAELTVTCSPEGPEATKVNVSVLVSPNLLTLLTTAEHRVLARFIRALGPLPTPAWREEHPIPVQKLSA